jgi:hypothetical protein
MTAVGAGLGLKMQIQDISSENEQGAAVRGPGLALFRVPRYDSVPSSVLAQLALIARAGALTEAMFSKMTEACQSPRVIITVRR